MDLLSSNDVLNEKILFNVLNNETQLWPQNET